MDCAHLALCYCLFLSTPSARRATLPFRAYCLIWNISIHALREEGDKDREPERDRLEISIHALREEGDDLLQAAQPGHLYFYPRPPRGGRLAYGGGIA